MIIKTPLPAPPSWWESWAPRAELCAHSIYRLHSSQASSWVSDQARVTGHSSQSSSFTSWTCRYYGEFQWRLQQKTWTDDQLFCSSPQLQPPRTAKHSSSGLFLLHELAERLLWIASDLPYGECPSITATALPPLKQKALQGAVDTTCWMATKLQFPSCNLFIRGLLTKPPWTGLSNFWCLPYGWFFGSPATYWQSALITDASLTPTGLEVFGSFMN